MMRIDFQNYKVPGIVLAVSFFRGIRMYLTIAGFSIIHSYSLFTSDRMASSIYLVFMFHGMCLFGLKSFREKREDAKCVISLKWQSCTGESCAAGSREARGTRNGQISVSVESRSSKTSRGENINVGTSILGHVVFFLAFVALFLAGIKTREKKKRRRLEGARGFFGETCRCIFKENLN